MAQDYREFELFSDADNLEIHGMALVPKGEIKGVVQLVHGMCEHKERYFEFMNYLAEKGYLCVIHDNRGHGQSVDSTYGLGHFSEGGAEALVDDIHQVTCLVKESLSEEKKNLPYILLGHSMGSLAVRCYTKKYDGDIDKLVVVGSPSNPLGVSAGLVLAEIMEKIRGGHKRSKLLDYLVMNSRYEKRFKKENLLHAWVCSDVSVVEKYNADPLCNYTFTINGYIQLTRLLKETYSKKGWKLNNPNLPILFVSGREDPCNISPRDFGKSVHFMKDVGYENVQARLYGGMRHEILNETRRKRVYRDIYHFILGESI